MNPKWLLHSFSFVVTFHFLFFLVGLLVLSSDSCGTKVTVLFPFFSLGSSDSSRVTFLFPLDFPERFQLIARFLCQSGRQFLPQSIQVISNQLDFLVSCAWRRLETRRLRSPRERP